MKKSTFDQGLSRVWPDQLGLDDAWLDKIGLDDAWLDKLWPDANVTARGANQVPLNRGDLSPSRAARALAQSPTI